MKLVSSISIALLIGTSVGVFWESKRPTADLEAERQEAGLSKSSNTRSKSPARSDSSSENFENTRIQNQPQPEGVFGEATEQIMRFQSMNSSDFGSEAEILMKSKDPDKDIQLYLLFTAWGEKDPKSALSYLQDTKDLIDKDDLSLRQIDSARWALYRAWAKQSPSSAVVYLEQNADLINGDRSLRYDIATISNQWLKQDPEATFAWLRDLDSNYKGLALERLFSPLAQENLPDALDKLAQLKVGEQRGAAKKVAQRFDETMSWQEVQSQIASLPPSTQTIMKIVALESYSDSNPYEATEIISDLDATKQQKGDIVKRVAQKIGAENPKDTLDWAFSNTERREQSFVANKVFKPWVEKSPNNAAQWLLTQPNNAVTKQMLKYLNQVESIPKSTKNRLQEQFGTES